MKRLDLIIDALEVASYVPRGFVMYPAGHHMQIAQALAAARELRELKPVAWAAPSIYGGFEGLSFDKQPRFETPLYALGDDK